MAEKTPVEQLTYKQASQELELIIRSLESGDMELEESLESYTRGVELLKSLRTPACPMPSRRSRCSLRTSTATTCSPTARPPTPMITFRSKHLDQI